MSACEVTSVWSSYGHVFISTGDGYESCLTCGALYVLVPLVDDPTRGEYLTASGGVPANCTRDTSMVHGYPGERVCDRCADDDADGCSHCAHRCPCIACNS